MKGYTITVDINKNMSKAMKYGGLTGGGLRLLLDCFLAPMLLKSNLWIGWKVFVMSHIIFDVRIIVNVLVGVMKTLKNPQFE